jgi:2-haloacid dehalogenase
MEIMPGPASLRDSIQLLTFDCYGTLIDWEAGIHAAIEPLAQRAKVPPAELIQAYIRIEASFEQQPYRRYRVIQAATVRELGKVFRFPVSDVDAEALSASLPQWQPFPDTVDALKRLKTRYALGILSNIDRDLLAASRRLLDVEFDLIVTAEDVASYKPALPHFLKMLSSGLAPRDRVLHVAQSLFHDGRPAQELGLSYVWIDRYGQRDRLGVPMLAAYPDLASLADELGV